MAPLEDYGLVATLEQTGVEWGARVSPVIQDTDVLWNAHKRGCHSDRQRPTPLSEELCAEVEFRIADHEDGMHVGPVGGLLNQCEDRPVDPTCLDPWEAVDGEE